MTLADVGPVVRVSFQRYPRPESGIVYDPPRSWGALPVSRRGPAEFVVPLPDDEAMWLGLSPAARGADAVVTVRAETEVGTWLDAASNLRIAPGTPVDGVRRQDGGWWPFTRVTTTTDAPSFRTIWIVDHVAQAESAIVLVAPGDFARETGVSLEPRLKAEEIYGGWRLP